MIDIDFWDTLGALIYLFIVVGLVLLAGKVILSLIGC